ncbi:MAG: hypothetical protein HWN65_12345 [Candidatus Helarchaeota archaeon]|nr:hypothetical protein [Candidatus Helarchaeota archaeon]
MIENVFHLFKSCEQSRFACKSKPFSWYISLSEKGTFQDAYDHIKEQDQDDLLVFEEMSSGKKGTQQRTTIDEIPFEVKGGIMVVSSPTVFYKNPPKNFYFGKHHRFHPETKEKLMSEHVCIVNVDSPRGILSFPREILEQALSPEDNRIRICLASVQLKRILKIKPYMLLVLRDSRFATTDNLQELDKLLELNDLFVKRSKMNFSLQLRFSTNELRRILSKSVKHLTSGNDILNRCILESWYYDDILKGWYLDHLSPEYPAKFASIVSSYTKHITPSKFGRRLVAFFRKFANVFSSIFKARASDLAQIEKLIPPTLFFKNFLQKVLDLDVRLIDVYDQTYRFKITTQGCKFDEIYVIDCPDTDGNNNFGIADTAIDALVLHPGHRNAFLFLINQVGKKVLWVRDRFLLDSCLPALENMFTSLGHDSPDNDMINLIKAKEKFVEQTNLPLTFRLSMRIDFLHYLFKYTYGNLEYQYIRNILGSWDYSEAKNHFVLYDLKPSIVDPQAYIRK